jgi:SAM-dependent methyltransferase
MAFDPATIRDFEHRGWQRAAAQYRATFARASAGFVAALLDAAEIGAGTRVLDLACGPGIAAAAAAARGAVVRGADFSPAMLELARAALPDAGFDEAEAERLPYADAGFDAVVSNFGVHHFPYAERAAAEMWRVLRPGGRVALTCWAAPAENAAWRLLFDAIAAAGVAHAAQTPPSGGTLTSAPAILRLLEGAGFRAATVALEAREWQVADGAALVDALRRGTVRTAALIDAQGAALPAVIAAIDRAAAPYRRGGGLAVPIAALLGRGVK